MPRAVILQCPICGSLTTFAGTKGDHSNEELQAKAKTHVSSHLLDESKVAIRKHQIAAEAEEVIVSAVDFDQFPTSEWQPPSDTWLPDGVTPTEVTGSSRPASSGDQFSFQPNAQD